jgi:hypothetical protein
MAPNDRSTQIETFISDLARHTDRIDATTQYLAKMAIHHSDQFVFVLGELSDAKLTQAKMQLDIDSLKE